MGSSWKIGIVAALVLVVIGTTTLVFSQEASPLQAGGRDANGTLIIQNGVLPPSVIESDDAKRLLAPPPGGAGRGGGRAAAATDGATSAAPAAPLSMAEQRLRAYENAKPRIQHAVDLYPVDIEETFMDGISVAVVTPKGGVPAANKNRVMLNVGGGGFRTNNRSVGLFISIPVASLGKMKVVTASYRQAPEFRFPAATEDFTKVYKYLLKTYKPKNIGMFGCSAGGALIAESVAAFQKEGLPAPGVLGLYCSGAGGRFDGDSLSYSNLTSRGGSQASAAPGMTGKDEYFEGMDLNRTDISPVMDLEILKKFPPTLLATGTRDFAMSMAAYTHRRLVAAGVDTRLLIFDGMGHGFMTNPDLPESRELYEDSVKFYDKHLGR